MDDNVIRRRDFLKQIGSFFAAIIAFRFRKLFGFFDKQKKDSSSLKEAKYYTQSDDLAG